ncbi:unnamed protein product [Porites evermanni]|uniref:Tyrosine-protein phosphatase domain-containing protein n=1 Tax=Porites evermanni TaxID=104178 RepID=A0ABN8SU87_9CNID|nr:unnamed protein product [Porites evermanni]
MTLRCDRNLIVQTEEQYAFIHEVLVEAIHGHTKIRAKMVEEFTRLSRGSAAPQSKFQAANMHYNKAKNLNANVLALDDTLVKLSAITGIEGSDYINANFIDDT